MRVDDEAVLGNPALEQGVEPENELKEWLINYVGEKHNPPDGKVTVEMIINTMSHEFPEFLMCVAEENWIRGYTQGLDDSLRLVEGQDDE